MSKIVVNDVLEELCEENKRLLNELMFANKSAKLLTQFKSFIDLISHKFVFNLNASELQSYNQLNEEIFEFIKECKEFNNKTNEKSTDNWVTNDNNIEIIDFDSDLNSNSNDCKTDDKSELTSHLMDSSAECRLNDRLKKLIGNSTNYLFGSQLILQKTTNDNNRIESEDDFSQMTSIESEDNQDSEDYQTIGSDLNASMDSTNNGFNDRTIANLMKKKTIGSTHKAKQAEKKPHKCSYCGKRFTYEECLRKHVVVNHLVSQEPLVCVIDNCNKQFKTKDSLTTHQRVHHFMEKKFVCDYPNCRFRFAYEKQLIAHKTVHSDDRPFVCPLDGCHKGFKTPYLLNSHLQSHRTDRNFQCPHEGCHKTYKSIKQLKQHIDTLHVNAS